MENGLKEIGCGHCLEQTAENYATEYHYNIMIGQEDDII